MSQNVVFCFHLTFSDLTLNPFIYGGCRDLRHNHMFSESDPFGAMRKLVKMTIYRGVNTMVLDG
jgi:hypothetical protein